MAGTSRAKLRPPLSSLSSSSSRRWWCSISFLMRFFLIVNICLFLSVWCCFYYYSTAYLHYHNNNINKNENSTTAIWTPHTNDKHDFLKQSTTPSLLSPKAYPVYGTHVEFDYNRGTKNKSITVVYALPSSRHYGSGGGGGNFTIRSSTDNNNNDTENNNNTIIIIKGIVILLHACTHNAFKFFSPSNDKCPECVGLSEELQLVRNVLNRGYVAFAVTCSNLQSGCWGGGDDDDDVDDFAFSLRFTSFFFLFFDDESICRFVL
jgi:hypothetical protein